MADRDTKNSTLHSHLADRLRNISSGIMMNYDEIFRRSATNKNHDEIINITGRNDLFSFEDSDDSIFDDSPKRPPGGRKERARANDFYPVDIGTKLLLIFNYFIVRGEKNRTGSDKDVANLKRTYEDKGFEVYTFEDLTREDTRKVLERYRVEPAMKDTAALFMIFMSHGDGKDPESFLSSDGKSIRMENDVRLRFNDRNCPLLEGKPKVMIGVCCRDSKGKKRAPVSPQHDSSFNDMLTIYSSARGQISYRDVTNGSLFVQVFCKVINEHGDKYDMYRIFSETQREMRQKRPPDSPSLEGYEPCLEPPLTFGTLYLD